MSSAATSSSWEQTLRERLSGTPLRMEARMQTESILYTTLWLFAGSFIAAMLVLADHLVGQPKEAC